MPDHYALIGNPVKHSISPRVHALFAQQTREDMNYVLILAPVRNFPGTLEVFIKEGGKGANVTLPFKGTACSLADERSERATVAKTANTLLFRDDGTIYADNTDGVGLVDDLSRLNCAVKGQSLLIVGAGGACCGIVPALLEAHPRELTIVNRTPHKAQKLAKRFAKFGAVSACTFEALAKRSFDGVINATSASLTGALPALPDTLTERLAWGYDLAYLPERSTSFVQWLKQHGVAAAHDGVGMLVAQAAVSFHLWRGVKPDFPKTLKLLTL